MCSWPIKPYQCRMHVSHTYITISVVCTYPRTHYARQHQIKTKMWETDCDALLRSGLPIQHQS
eukprot:jgi/Botrbrau1/3720/Bobra.0363s0007.1